MQLIALSGPHAGRAVDVAGTLTIGRAADRALQLSDPKVSRHHARVWRADDSLRLRDDGSLNGTWLNDERIASERALRVGDRVRIGGSEFLVRDDGDDGRLADARVGDEHTTEPAERRQETVALRL